MALNSISLDELGSDSDCQGLQHLMEYVLFRRSLLYNVRMFSNATYYLSPELGNGTASMKFFLVNKTVAGVTGD